MERLHSGVDHTEVSPVRTAASPDRMQAFQLQQADSPVTVLPAFTADFLRRVVDLDSLGLAADFGPRLPDWADADLGDPRDFLHRIQVAARGALWADRICPRVSSRVRPPVPCTARRTTRRMAGITGTTDTATITILTIVLFS